MMVTTRILKKKKKKQLKSFCLQTVAFWKVRTWRPSFHFRALLTFQFNFSVNLQYLLNLETSMAVKVQFSKDFINELLHPHKIALNISPLLPKHFQNTPLCFNCPLLSVSPCRLSNSLKWTIMQPIYYCFRNV